jgi:hypothetical protein
MRRVGRKLILSLKLAWARLLRSDFPLLEEQARGRMSEFMEKLRTTRF